MHRDYSNVDPRVLSGANKSVAAQAMDKHEELIKNRIEVLREQGLSDDEILLQIIEENSRHKSNSSKKDSSNQKVKTKSFTYNSDIFKK